MIAGASVSLAFSFSSCSEVGKQRSESDTSTETFIESTVTVDPESEHTESTVDTSDTKITTISEATPTGFEAYIGETLPTIEYKSPDDMVDFGVATTTHNIQFMGMEFGFDNAKMKQKIQEYLGMPDVNLYDIGYLQEEYSHYDIGRFHSFKDYQDFEGQNVECQIAMYILQSLGRRLYVDEIPYEFFTTNFPDLLDMLDVELHGDDPNFNAYGQDVLWLDYNQDEIFKFTLARTMDEITNNLGTPNDVEILRRLIFSSAFRYNQSRCSLVYDYRGTGEGEEFKAVYIPQVRTADGKNALLFDQRNYDLFMKDLHDQDCYKNIEDLYTPLTEDDLVKGGINIDEFKYVIEDVTGVTFDLENVKDGNPRAKTS